MSWLTIKIATPDACSVRKICPKTCLNSASKSLCRLVEEQNVWVQKQDFRQRRALLFAAGKVIRMAVEQLRQLAEGNDLCKPLGFAFGFW